MTQERIDKLVHDLNNPLQVVKSCGQLLAMPGPWTGEELVQIGRDLIRAVDEVHRIFQEFRAELG